MRRLIAWWCWLFGHDIEDCSIVNGEMAIEDLHCNRCGWDHHHTYY